MKPCLYCVIHDYIMTIKYNSNKFKHHQILMEGALYQAQSIGVIVELSKAHTSPHTTLMSMWNSDENWGGGGVACVVVK